MGLRPELVAPPEIFYDQSEARKYTSSSHISDIQAKLSERALELLALPEDGVPRLLLDIGCGSGLSGETLSETGHQWIDLDISQAMLDVAVEREAKGNLLLADMGQALGLRSGVIDGAISISALQWLCNADKSCHEPRLRLKAFFGSLYSSLARGARAVLQLYPQNDAQRHLLFGFAMRAGFGGWVLVDYPRRFLYQIGIDPGKDRRWPGILKIENGCFVKKRREVGVLMFRLIPNTLVVKERAVSKHLSIDDTKFSFQTIFNLDGFNITILWSGIITCNTTNC